MPGQETMRPRSPASRARAPVSITTFSLYAYNICMYVCMYVYIYIYTYT